MANYSTSPSGSDWCGGQEKLQSVQRLAKVYVSRCIINLFIVKSELAGSNFFPCASHIHCSIHIGLFYKINLVTYSWPHLYGVSPRTHLSSLEAQRELGNFVVFQLLANVHVVLA